MIANIDLLTYINWQYILSFVSIDVEFTGSINTCSCCLNISWKMIRIVSMVKTLLASLPVSADSCRSFRFPCLVIIITDVSLLLCTFNWNGKIKNIGFMWQINESNVRLINLKLSSVNVSKLSNRSETFSYDISNSSLIIINLEL